MAGMNDLGRATELALAALEADAEQDLRPVVRKEIWMALMNANNVESQCRRVLLGCQCVEYVLSVWTTAIPNCHWPQKLLLLAADVCRSRVDQAIADEEMWKAWTWSTNENVERKIEVPLAALEVLDAARETVRIAFTPDPFNGVELNDTIADKDLDPYTRDPAICAAMALADAVQNPTVRIQAVRNYWLWWLRDAVPTAWNQGPKILEDRSQG